jgi:hypothetical protein
MDSLVGQNLDETIPANFYQAAMLATVWDLYNSYVVDLKENGCRSGGTTFSLESSVTCRQKQTSLHPDKASE